MSNISDFVQAVQNTDNIVFFGGAGVSTESGIPDFRSKDGLYNQKYDYPPEEILSRTFFDRHTEEFYRFYRDKLNSLDVQPNITHKVLARLEQEGKLKAIVTQNIDGLHQKAGSERVYELHGSVMRNYCVKCRKFHSAESIFAGTGIPLCECGGIVKPDVVLYEEPLDERTVSEAVAAIRHADVLIVAGTSLTVYPASGLINYFNGSKLILINRDATPYDRTSYIVLHESFGEVFSLLDKA